MNLFKQEVKGYTIKVMELWAVLSLMSSFRMCHRSL